MSPEGAPTPANDKQPAEPTGSKHQPTPPKKRWTAGALDAALKKRRNEVNYDRIRDGVEAGQDQMFRMAKRIFGRNAVVKYFGCSGGLVSNSTVWKSIAAELKLSREARSTITAAKRERERRQGQYERMSRRRPELAGFADASDDITELILEQGREDDSKRIVIPDDE